MVSTTTNDGVDIAYDVTGDGPGLVLVHGLTENRRVWDPLVADLATDHTVLAVDIRGHGESAVAAPYDPPTLAGDVAVAVDAAGLANPVVIGHSMGGIVVTAYGAQHPCRGVVNIDQSIALGDFQAMVQGVEPMLRGDGFGDLITGLFDSFDGALAADEVARLRALRRPDQEVVLGMWGPVLELSLADLTEVVRSLTSNVHVPYLALHGTDPGREYGHWLATEIPTSTVEVWDDSGHYPHLVHPQRFLDRVRAFESTLA